MFDNNQRVAQDFEFFYRAFKKYPHKLIPEVLVTARDSHSRQGLRCKVKGVIEYSLLFIKIIENLSEDEIVLLAKSKMDFYIDMYDFFKCCGYTIALEYMKKKIEDTDPDYFVVQEPIGENISVVQSQGKSRTAIYFSLVKLSLKRDGFFSTMKKILKKVVNKLRRK
jgi:hypothetical protein